MNHGWKPISSDESFSKFATCTPHTDLKKKMPSKNVISKTRVHWDDPRHI